jgi:hypothetical protein
VGGNTHRSIKSLKGEQYENTNKKKNITDSFIYLYDAVHAAGYNAFDSVC